MSPETTQALSSIDARHLQHKYQHLISSKDQGKVLSWQIYRKTAFGWAGLLTFIWKGESHWLPCLDLMQVVHFFIAEATSLNRTSQPSMSFPYKNAQPSLTLEPHGPRAWWRASCSQRPPWAEQRNRWWLSQPLASPASTDPDELCMSTKII